MFLSVINFKMCGHQLLAFWELKSMRFKIAEIDPMLKHSMQRKVMLLSEEGGTQLKHNIDFAKSQTLWKWKARLGR